jgi:transcriptional regulator with XRE-family HTH domain
MSSGDTPAVARRKVRLAVRDARNAKGYTQTQVAEAMDWSLSKVMRIESGEVTISQNDLRPLLTYLGIRDRTEVEDLVAAAKASKQRRQWWDDKRFQGMLTPAMKQLVSFEAEATVIRHFSTVGIPGVLQTRDYARGVMQQYTGDLSEDEIEARIESRIRRKSALLQRTPRPHLFTLFDESVLARNIGGRQVMGEQLTAIAQDIEDGWLSVRIHPLDNPYPGIGPFEILYLGSSDVSEAVLYRESMTLDEVIDDPERIKQHQARWELLWDASVDEAASTSRITALAHEIRSAGEKSSG